MRMKPTFALASVLTASALAAGGAAYADGAQAPQVHVAAADTLTAPYAQAAAFVAADGSLVHGKGIASVQRTGAGRYTITLQPDINAEKSVPQVTLNQSANWKGEVFAKVVNASTISVLTGANGTASNQPFYFLLP